MSSAYNLEPPTKGKVILKTSLGDLEIELWPKEAPKACRNFVQMCLEGYYDGTIFHRIIKDYLVQGGDPTGTGDESESSYGELFKDEFHTRLKFTHRGLVACANQNRPNSNGSQFFITLEKTEWLDQKNTIFGKIVGDTIYNLLRIGECGTDDADRPLEPPVLKQVEVVWNPFDDIVPRRNRAAEREETKRAEAAAAAIALKQNGTKRNLKLLSFGDEVEEEELQSASAAPRSKMISAHDVLDDPRLAKEDETPVEERIYVERPAKRSREEDEKVAKAVSHARAAMQSAKAGGPSSLDDGEDEDEVAGEAGLKRQKDGAAARGVVGGSSSAKDFGAAMHDRMMEKRRLMGDPPSSRQVEAVREAPVPTSLVGRSVIDGDNGAEDEDEEDGDGDDDDGSDGGRPKDFRSERNDRINTLRMENKRKGIGRMTAPDAVENADLLKPWQLAREKYKQQKRLVGDREKTTLARLKQFTANLKAASGSNGARKEPPQDEEQAPGAVAAEAEADGGYDGKVRTDIDHKTYLPPSWRVDDYLDRDDLEASLDDLCTHKLAFTKNTGRVDNMERNMTDNVDDYVVFDPLLEKGKGKFSKAEQDKKKRQNEWSGKANQ